MTFLRVNDGIINLNAIQHIRRVRRTVTLYFEGDFYDATFDTEDDAIDYICGLSSMLGAKKPGGLK